MRKWAKKELKKIKEKLIKLRDGISQELKNIGRDSISRSQREATGDLSGYSFHMADVASDNYDRDLSVDLADGEQKFLYEIDLALERIANNTFGSCELCSADISKQRLNAIPYTRFCLKCQQQKETKTRG